MRNNKEKLIKRMKKQMFSIGILLLFICGILLWMKFGEYTNYWKKIGRNYNQVVKKWGNPKDIEQEELYDKVYYEGIELTCDGKNHEWVHLAVIENPNVRFGFLKIGVGSSETMVETVYCLKKKLDTGDNDSFGVIDGITYLTFEYDSNRKVKRMYLGL